jgi:hypothetical protein
LPAATVGGCDPGGSPEICFITATADCAWTEVVAVAVFEFESGDGSEVVELTVAVLLIDAPVNSWLTFTTIVKVCAEEPAGSVAREHATVPVPPTDGVEQVHSTGAVIDTNVVFAGTASDITAFCASLGPAVVTFIV